MIGRISGVFLLAMVLFACEGAVEPDVFRANEYMNAAMEDAELAESRGGEVLILNVGFVVLESVYRMRTELVKG